MKQCEMSIACDAIKKLDNMEDLNIVIRQVKLTQKALKLKVAQEAKSTFNVGDTVNIKTRNGDDMKGVITKMNRTRAVCLIGDGGMSYNVPFSIMEAA